MNARLRRALPTTASIVAIEALVVLMLAPMFASVLAERTGALLDPTRIIAGWVERTADSGVRESLAPLVPSLVGLGSFVLLEPFLHVLFVRGHESPGSRGRLRLHVRVARTVAIRTIGLFAIAVFCALVFAGGFAARVGLDRLGDPRPRDLVSALFCVVALVALLRAYVLTEVATIRTAVRDESALESLVRSYPVAKIRLVAIRTACALASATVSFATVFGPQDPLAAAVLAVVVLSVRGLIRSAYIGHVIGESSDLVSFDGRGVVDENR